MKSVQARLLPILLLLAGIPATASAHSAVNGVGDFFGGVFHPFTTPTHLIALLALGLFAGQRAQHELKTPLFVFVIVAAVALLLTTTGIVTTVYPPILIGLALAVAVLVALEKSMPQPARIALFALTALVLGLDSGVEKGTSTVISKTLLGTWCGLTLAVADIAFYISRFTKQKWQKVGLRVAGSWIIAISLMILAFAFRRN